MSTPNINPQTLPNGSITTFFRGHLMRWDIYAQWWYFDTSGEIMPIRPIIYDNVVAGIMCNLSDKIPCKTCGCVPTIEGHDGCLGRLPGVAFACCGHGIEEGYVMWKDGITVRFPSWSKK